MYIPLEEVESSNLVAIGYHRQTSTLRIMFKGNRAYDYPMVPEREYKALMAAESKGKFFNARIKPMYGHRTVREEALVKPCCEHPGPDPTCTDECYPCTEWCCPGPMAATVAAAVRLGMERGAGLMEAVRLGGDVQVPLTDDGDEAEENLHPPLDADPEVQTSPPATEAESD